MSKIASKLRTEVGRRPNGALHKVILVNDDFTPREFVVVVLKSEFRMNEDQAYRVMVTAHRRGSCVVASTPRTSPSPKRRAARGARARAIRCCSPPSGRVTRAIPILVVAILRQHLIY